MAYSRAEDGSYKHQAWFSIHSRISGELNRLEGDKPEEK